MLRSITKAHENIISTYSGGVWRRINGGRWNIRYGVMTGVMGGGGNDIYGALGVVGVVSQVFSCFFLIGVMC